MKIIVEDRLAAFIVKVQGRIDIGVGEVKLRDCLTRLDLKGVDVVILDLAKVSHVDSSGMGELIACYSHFRKNGVELCLSNLNTRVYSLMVLTQMITIFPVYDSNEDALMNLVKAA